MNPTDPQQSPVPTTTTPATPPIAQPSPSASVVSGVVPLNQENTNKQQRIGLILGIISIAGFIISLFVGYSLALVAILGAYTLSIGVRTKSVGLIILGSFGTVLNLGLFILAAISNL
ncbi:MAG: hypothetical protein ABIP50_01550 [Candidatus Saccharimonadales bacterium]